VVQASLKTANDVAGWRRVREAVDRAREVLGDDPVDEARSVVDGAEANARDRLYLAGISAARDKLYADGGGLRLDRSGAGEAETFARMALRNLPMEMATEFARLAVALRLRTDQAGASAARRSLRAALAQHPRGEEAWLLLELAVAVRLRRQGEKLVPRLEGITLGQAGSDINPEHLVGGRSGGAGGSGGAGSGLAPYYLDTYEASLRDYAAYLEAEPGVSAPAGWKLRVPSPGTEDQPVTNVTFAEAERYARFVGKRLPTADEWEAAAAVVPGREARRRYPWGDGWLQIHARQAEGPRSVGGSRADKSPWGCMDMGGNVSEWTQEGGGGRPVLQGGSYAVVDFRHLFDAVHRNFPDAGERSEDWGVRCAQDVTAPELAEFEEVR
jgi:hypothetical protein